MIACHTVLILIKPNFQSNSKGNKPLVDGKDTLGPMLPGQNHDLTSEQLRAGFEARQSSLAYQEMLVRSSITFSLCSGSNNLYTGAT